MTLKNVHVLSHRRLEVMNACNPQIVTKGQYHKKRSALFSVIYTSPLIIHSVWKWFRAANEPERNLLWGIFASGKKETVKNADSFRYKVISLSSQDIPLGHSFWLFFQELPPLGHLRGTCLNAKSPLYQCLVQGSECAKLLPIKLLLGTFITYVDTISWFSP